MSPLNRLLIIAGVASVAACSTSKPVLNFDNQPIAGQHTTEQVRTAIAAAAKTRGWIVEDVGPGELKATINVRVYHAVANIKYTATQFDIHYVESTNLDYKDGKIHRNYNRWVNNLRIQIEKEIPSL